MAQDSEYPGERLMQDVKTIANGKRVPQGIEKTVANHLIQRHAERDMLRAYPAALGPIEALVDPQPSAAERAACNSDACAAGPAGGRFIGKARQPTRRRCTLAKAALPRLFGDGSEHVNGWDLAAAEDAFKRRSRGELYARATLGPGDGNLFSLAYGRQRNRISHYVMVDWGTEEQQHMGRRRRRRRAQQEQNTSGPHICRVEFFLKLSPPASGDGEGSGAAADAGGGQAADASGSGAEAGGSTPSNGTGAGSGGGELPPLRIAFVTAYPAEEVEPGKWRADANRPSDGGTLWPVLLESIACKLLMAAPSRDLRQGTLYGMKYQSLSRVG